MTVKLDKIIPWGRSRREYERMFGLTQKDLRRKILGCGDGPASFNTEMTAAGFSVVSCDPLYAFDAAGIAERFEAGIEPLMSQVRSNMRNYVWSYHQGPDELLRYRKAVLASFVTDYPRGLAQGRYVAGGLPALPFARRQFDLALCSHLLFLYSTTLDLDFHLKSVVELCRVAREVRIFPLTGLDCEISPHVAPVQARLRQLGLSVSILTRLQHFEDLDH